MIPLNETAIAAMEAHAAWYARRFGECWPEWFVVAFGSPLPADPTRPITSFKAAWIKSASRPGVKGRWHDNRHTLFTELAEPGAGDEVIMSIAGHVSRTTLSRYSDVRVEKQNGAHWTRSPHASAGPTRSARRGHRSRKLRWSARCGPGGCLDHLAARPALDGDIPDAVAF